MSALIRYFLSLGKRVAGYDRTPSHLTRQLEDEGARLHYEENPSLIHPCRTIGPRRADVVCRERLRVVQTRPGAGAHHLP